jgi:hypothetical protein
VAAGEGGNDGALHVGRDHAHRFGVGLGGNREARFDDVHPERAQLPCQLELFVDPQRKAGRLLAVPQGGIEDGQPVAGHWECLLSTVVAAPGATSQIYSYLGMISLAYAVA